VHLALLSEEPRRTSRLLVKGSGVEAIAPRSI
jgi:hypothetical protein